MTDDQSSAYSARGSRSGSAGSSSRSGSSYYDVYDDDDDDDVRSGSVSRSHDSRSSIRSGESQSKSRTSHRSGSSSRRSRSDGSSYGDGSYIIDDDDNNGESYRSHSQRQESQASSRYSKRSNRSSSQKSNNDDPTSFRSQSNSIQKDSARSSFGSGRLSAPNSSFRSQSKSGRQEDTVMDVGQEADEEEPSPADYEEEEIIDDDQSGEVEEIIEEEEEEETFEEEVTVEEEVVIEEEGEEVIESEHGESIGSSRSGSVSAFGSRRIQEPSSKTLKGSGLINPSPTAVSKSKIIGQPAATNAVTESSVSQRSTIHSRVDGQQNGKDRPQSNSAMRSDHDGSNRSRSSRSSKSSTSTRSRLSRTGSQNSHGSSVSNSQNKETQSTASRGRVRGTSHPVGSGTVPRPVSKEPQRDRIPSPASVIGTNLSSHGIPNGNEHETIDRPKSIAILGTMSDAGKSVIAAAICRILVNDGKRVAPFKAQNMSNNASPAILPDIDRRNDLYKTFERTAGGPVHVASPIQDPGYGEIGTAQSLQAEACKLVPRVEMNPVLLKSGGKNSKGEAMCSVFVLGKQVIRETYDDLRKRTGSLQQMVIDSHKALADVTDPEVIVIEGAGSCTELNLMDRDIVNLPLVRTLQCPWLLVANIDCGGVFAQVVGTKACCSERDWSLCMGVIVNKLRGDAKFFSPGPKILEQMVGKPIFVVPYLDDLHLPEEDGMGIERRLRWEKTSLSSSMRNTQSNGKKDQKKKPVVVVVAYPHTAIADDLCPLEQDNRFEVEWRRKLIPKPYPHTTAVVLPGSRLTLLDLKWLNDSGWLGFIRKHVAAGGTVLGLCGGYQMLGWQVNDPDAVEGREGKRQGVGLLPINTTIAPVSCKVVKPRAGQLYPSGIHVEGFELHCGQSDVLSAEVSLLGKNSEISPLLAFSNGKPEGMQLGRVRGTYLHGILRSEKARVELLVPDKNEFTILKSKVPVVDPLDKFANHVASCGLHSKALAKLVGL